MALHSRASSKLRFGHREALAQLTLPASVQAELAEYGIHPATLDACIQTLVALTPDWLRSEELWMPRTLGKDSLVRHALAKRRAVRLGEADQ